jgi:hypothetical protein
MNIQHIKYLNCVDLLLRFGVVFHYLDWPHVKACFNHSVLLFQHEFLTRHQQQRNILKELVKRTKSQVRALDNMNYKRVKKIFMNDTAGGENSSSFDNDDEDDTSSQVKSFISSHSLINILTVLSEWRESSTGNNK